MCSDILAGRERRKKTPTARVVGLIILFALVTYVSMSWMRFAILHPSAGEGAFYTHFVEVVTWGEVPSLQESEE